MSIPGETRRCSRALLASVLLLFGQSINARADNPVTARQHYERGTTLYDLGRFAEAAKEFEAAYEDKNDPALLFNIGRAYRFAGSYQRSLIAYRAYLRNLPNAANRDEVENNIVELNRLIEQQPGAVAKPAPAESPARAVAPAEPAGVVVGKAPPARRPVYKKWWLWTTAGVVVATGLAVGLAVGLAKPTSSERVLPPATGAP